MRTDKKGTTAKNGTANPGVGHKTRCAGELNAAVIQRLVDLVSDGTKFSKIRR